MELLAQCFVLLIAGYDSTGNTMHFILYHLAKLPDLQRKAQQEIEDVVGDSEHVTYDHIMNLPYLQQVISETLRMYPSAVLLSRQCSEPTTISAVPFEKGTLMSVPVYRIHHDPEIYPEPVNFDPDRFSPEQKAQRDPLAFLPFGHGPMNCLGMRLAEIELRITMAVLLRRYNFYPGKESPELPLEIECVGLLQSKKKLFVTAERRV
ncbi:cyp3a90-like protein [Aphelenchoides avenae]|nr:cyp3a90-like protein [Aphelenchus avenae]